MCRSSTLIVLADSGPFHGLLLTVLGPEAIFLVYEPQGALTCMTLTLTVLGSQSNFLWLLNPKVRLRIVHQRPPFWSILTRFMDYYSPFWGPRGVSTIDDPWGAFTCPSSTLTVLADSDPFRGLSLTVLGS